MEKEEKKEPKHEDKKTRLQHEGSNWIAAMIVREALPVGAREEKTRAFCQKHGIPESTYYWHRDTKKNQRKILETQLREARRYTPEVLQKLGENALEGKEKSIEMFLKFVVEIAEKTDITTDGKPIESILSTVKRRKEEEEEEE